MSSTLLAETAVQARIRDKLNQESIKLWTEPFYEANSKTVIDSEVLALAARYSTEFQFPESEVVDCLFTLQRNAIQRVVERDHFKSTGLATIRIKFSGSNKLGGSERIQVNLKDTTGMELKTRIGELVSVHENRLKLICMGRVINDSSALEFQNIKNGSQLMVLIVSTDQESFEKVEDQFRQLEETRGAADYLAGRSQAGHFSLQVADQHGNPLDLPENEKKALAVALALHEKGRSSLKLAEFAKALVFLLEADGVYSQCHSNILDMVDNYGLLNLDIAWCYLCLQSIAELPAVETRLSKCERALHKSYGENMERVIALKGSSGLEAALFVRLHLLQGISAYHLGSVEKSKFYLAKVESEIQRLMVSDDQLADLINMGYGADEARMALRATFGNLTAAVDWIIRKREEKAEIKKKEAIEWQRQKYQKKLGFCDNGDPVNMELWRKLKEMGFEPTLARAALKRANNDLNEAVQFAGDPQFIGSVITELPSQKIQSPPPIPENPSTTPTPSQPSTSDAPASPNSIFSDLAREASEFFGLTPDTLSEEQLIRNQEEAEKSQKAFEALSKDICSEAEYIDLALSAETNYLTRSIISNVLVIKPHGAVNNSVNKYFDFKVFQKPAKLTVD